MHRGHAVLLQRARDLAAKVAVVTFEPHPSAILAPDRAPPRLQSPAQRERWCKNADVDVLVVLPFTQTLAGLTAEAFLQEYLIAGLTPAAVVVGEDFRYGLGRKGNAHDLAAKMVECGRRAEVVDEQRCAGLSDESGKISSTRIRRAIEAGAVEHAAALLGRWYAAEGEIVHGDGRGRKLGFPTANFASSNLLPSAGVYAGYVRFPGGAETGANAGWRPAVANVGTNPTFTPGRQRNGLEVHVLSGATDAMTSQNWYGKTAEFSFVQRLRDEQRFPDVSAIVKAIENDIATARTRLDDSTRAFLEA
jgi:riboflavin kinase/FMN adenylyltransferase